jgi:hypothetical protein
MSWILNWRICDTFSVPVANALVKNRKLSFSVVSHIRLLLFNTTVSIPVVCFPLSVGFLITRHS